jgi:hypothetical protein
MIAKLRKYVSDLRFFEVIELNVNKFVKILHKSYFTSNHKI